MEIIFAMSGGFAYVPALAKPFIIDTARIDAKIGRQLEFLVRETRFFDLPACLETPVPGAADYRTYTITVRDGPRAHTVQLTDPITDANLERLVSRIQFMARPTTP